MMGIGLGGARRAGLHSWGWLTAAWMDGIPPDNDSETMPLRSHVRDLANQAFALTDGAGMLVFPSGGVKCPCNQ